MNIRNMIFTIFLTLILTTSMVSATVTEPNIMRYGEILTNGDVLKTTDPVTDVNIIGFVCSSEDCATVSHALDLSNGNVIADINNAPVLTTGTSDTVNVIYPTTHPNTEYGYGLYVYKNGYIPNERAKITWAGTGTVDAWTNYLTKKQSCISAINNLTVLNAAQANIPLIINIDASLDATTYSAIESAGPLEHIPSQIEDQYSVETTVTMTVYNSSDDIVYTNSSVELIPYSDSITVEFTWTPAEAGTYKIIATSTATDAKCLSSDPQTTEKSDILVYAEAPRNECYTILNGLSASDPQPEINEQVTISYNKISNHANDEVMGAGSYVLTPTETGVTYTIKDSSDATVYSDTKTISANTNAIDAETYSFEWTPQTPDTYTVTVTGVCASALCDGLTNPTVIDGPMTITALDTTPPQILTFMPTEDQHVNTFNLEATTDEDATCKYDTTDTDYSAMANTFTATGTTDHTQELTLVDGIYTYYARCQDNYANANQESNMTSFEIDTKPYIAIHTDNITINQTDRFTINITLENYGYSTAEGTLTITIPERLTLVSGNTEDNITIIAGDNHTYELELEATWWGDYVIDIEADYNSQIETSKIYVQSTPIPIYEFRIASPDELVKGDSTQVAIGIYNRGIVNGNDATIEISTTPNLAIVGPSSKEITTIYANTTEQNASWIDFDIEGISSGTGTIYITVDEITQEKTIVIKDTHLYIDLSVSPIAPFNMSLGRSFLVTAVIYNTGNSTSLATKAEIALETGLETSSTNPVLLGDIEPTVNGTPPIKQEWIINSTSSGPKQINMTIISLFEPEYNASESVMINILDLPEPVQPFITIESDVNETIPYGTTFDITAKIKNIGTDASINTLAQISGVEGLEFITPQTIDIGALEINQETTITWTLNATATGTFNPQITITEIQHQFSDKINFDVRYDHDVRLSGFNAPASANTGNTILISGLLENAGLYDENGINVTLSIDGNIIATKTYDLTSGNTTGIEFGWTASEGTHTLKLSAYIPNDQNTSNNNLSGTITVTTETNDGGSSSRSSSRSSYIPPAETNETENTTEENLTTIYIPETELADSLYIGQTITLKGCLTDPQSDTVDLAIDDEIVKTQDLDENDCFSITYKIEGLDEGTHSIAIMHNGETLYSKEVLVYQYAPTEYKEDKEPTDVTVIDAPTGNFLSTIGSANTIIYLLILLIIIAVYIKRETIRASVIKK